MFTNKKPVYLFSISDHKEAIHVNSLEITFFQPSIDFHLYDGFLLTSKQGVAALRHYKKSTYIDIPALCISKATAKSYEELGGKVLDIGKGYGDTLVTLVKKYPKTKRWLYLRAEKVASDFVSVLKNEGYFIDEAIVYKSECSKEILNVTVEENAILIFTSPSSIHCYLKNHTILNTQQVVAIGNTTARALDPAIKYSIAPEPTITSCLETIKNLR